VTDRKWDHQEGDKKRVVVIGAGVAGMTAAHELVERGYEVEVVEMSAEPFNSTRPRIGGMARTSWARVPSAAGRDHPAAKVPVEQRMVQLFTDHAPPPLEMNLTEITLPKAQAFVRALRALPARREATVARARGVKAANGENSKKPDSKAPIDLVSVISSRKLEDDQRKTLEDILKGYRVTLETVSHPDHQTPEDARVQICMEGSRVAGEHGFRFFPSFYRHLFDTMKRIPIQEAAPGTRLTADSPRTAFDALLSAEVLQVGLEPAEQRDRSFEIARRPMRSLQEIRTFLAHVLEDAGYRGEDLFRLVHRYAEYLTSSEIRRTREYENMSWSAFLELPERFSPYFASHVNSGAQALVAMSSEDNDARTIGSIAMQLTLDQVRDNPSDYTDGTLRGPTTIELFEPWKAYLRSQDVRFECAELVGFYGHGMAVRPAFGRRPAEAGDKPAPRSFELADIAPADYYVVTVPVDRFQALFDKEGKSTAEWVDEDNSPALLSRDRLVDANIEHQKYEQAAQDHVDAKRGENPDDISKYLRFPLGQVDEHPDAGPLRYMCGIQFYFPADVRVILGHTVCLDSPWGVSYISQVQYWQDHIRDHSGVRGIFSAIFTLFEKEAEGLISKERKTAMQCNADEIADRVWKQILDSWDEAKFGDLPKPEYYYLDESLRYDQQKGTWTNDTPYLVNRVGDWEKRGGVRLPDGSYAYRMQLGHTVFAGAFMRTETRLNTMEAANESGRRAVNAILDHDDAPHQLCKVWNIEDHEIPEARPLRELDRRVYGRGGRHILRNAGFEAVLRVVPWDLLRIGLPTREEQS
jgi:uncharacterized protein with NAD-binding domain and iron-sulfur cluster